MHLVQEKDVKKQVSPIEDGAIETISSSRRVYVALPRKEKYLIKSIRNAKRRLIEGLSSVESPNGWGDPTAESQQSLWTSMEVLKSLVESGILPRNYTSVLRRVAESRRRLDSLCGWEYEGLENRISVYVTGDGVKLYLALEKFDAVEELVRSLQAMQNQDGGWGVCSGDSLSKVRSTGWVLRTLLACLNNPLTAPLVQPARVNDGLRWLYNAQNDFNGDTGWGNMPNSLPSNVTATVFSLDALLEAMKDSLRPDSSDLLVRVNSIKRGLRWLIDMNADGYWRAVKEEFGINLDGELPRRHIIGGAGTTLAVQVLIKACEVGIVAVPHDVLHDGMNDLVQRCSDYHGVTGGWLVPADDGGAPLSWNSAFALESFAMFEKFYLENIAETWMEKPLYDAITRGTAFWRRAAVFFLFTTLGVALTPWLRTLGQIPSWFAGLHILYQSLILIVVTILVEEIYSRVLHTRVVPALLGLWKR